MEEQQQISHQQSVFYKLLMDSGKPYRIGRHLVLILAISIISFNQTYTGIYEYGGSMDHKFFTSTFLLIITYLLAGYLNLYIFIPRYFLKKRYLIYFTLFFLLIFVFVIFHYTIEYYIYKIYYPEKGIHSYFDTYGSPFWLEFIASYFVDCIAISGVGLIVLLKQWLIKDQLRNEMEKKHYRTEADKLKEQVNPEFLLSILHKMGDLCIVDQQKASDMLLELSNLLRYQLYDSNREKVLLNAEINFIANYLRIEKLYDEKVDFEINTNGEINKILLPPFLFIPLLHYALKGFQREGDSFLIRICFQTTDHFISFSCDCTDKTTTDSDQLKSIRFRLQKLYKEKYLLKTVKRRQETGKILYLQLFHRL